MDTPRAEVGLKIRKTSLPDEIVEAIKGTIKNGEWKTGQKLPSENELSEMFGVNRLTVRMALQKLNAQGIVETRVGEGSYVKDFDFGEYIGEVSSFYLTPDMIGNVCEFRKSLEVECARLAMERSSAEELEEFGAICDRYDTVCARLFSQTEFDPDTLDEMIDRDLEFHERIVRLSRNTLYKYSFEVAREPITRYLHLIVKRRFDSNPDKRDTLMKACGEHRKIYEAIKSKDLETCRASIVKMIDYTTDI